MPETLLARFRTSAFERLERIDTGWAALLGGTASPQVEQEVFRDLHTLRGEAGVVGAKDVVLLARRLEDLVYAARDCSYRVKDDVDIVVTMAIQFIGILLRRSGSSPQPGIDIPGFVKQVEEVLSLTVRRSTVRPPRGAEVGRLGARARHDVRTLHARLAVAATTVYLEHLRASGASKERLRGVWDVVSETASLMAGEPLAPVLQQHAAAANALAPDLGKRVAVEIDADGVHASGEVIEVVGTALLHAVRNAIDHGIESPETRTRAGKSAEGRLRITAVADGEHLDVTLEDDGGGVDVERVRSRAVEMGVVSDGRAAALTREEVLDLVFAAHVSTRGAAGEVSGRGIGLDAARAAIESLGGRIVIDTPEVGGTRLRIRVPRSLSRVDVTAFRVGASEVQFALASTWDLRAGAAEGVVDPLALLDLPCSPSFAAGDDVRVVRFVDGERSFAIRVRGQPSVVTATRVCPTRAGEPAEVVGTADGLAILLRPEVLFAPDRP